MLFRSGRYTISSSNGSLPFEDTVLVSSEHVTFDGKYLTIDPSNNAIGVLRESFGSRVNNGYLNEQKKNNYYKTATHEHNYILSRNTTTWDQWGAFYNMGSMGAFYNQKHLHM